LQGGGSWGAFTWGALDALLAQRTIEIRQVSGTSAGAINAAIVAGSLAKGSRAQARKALRSSGCRSRIPPPRTRARVRGPLERHWRNPMNDLLLASGAMCLYAGSHALNALRDAIDRHVDIGAIRSKSAPALFATVTNVRSGLLRVISNADLSIDALLASACLPDLFPVVELDGEFY